ncbi:DUF559 domain-containing protein [Rhodococcus sp. BP-332]|uniref:type IV toxin-antitoxin system AbiEi family antitoxin domain-containing protein n=1 Tax=Rhodococcus sp. BP-332 TaxID=2739447 RepID=UPI001C9B33CF|nr:type IV toxin-antitoxin system AbiEi family antitoxin domain-containing protein [Rhodococcus sp. BP-332]MBY6676758.1 DUF559 domain-containing protein [Rhodococcus sp. BP-332]
MIDRLLALHDGVITATQAHDAGMSQDAIDRRVRAGHWRRVTRGVYVACDRPWTDAARVRCAAYWAGDGAVVTSVSAAYWHGLVSVAPRIVDVTVPRGGRSRAPSGVRVRRRNLDPADVVAIRGIRVTASGLTVLEASEELGMGIIDVALRGRMSPSVLRRAHDRNPRRRGAPAAEKLLVAAEGGARSEAERLFLAVMRNGRITGFLVNFPWRGYVLDFVFLDERVCIEIDGWAFHSDPTAFHRDRTRQNVVVQEWTVLRYTWRDLTQRPDEVIAEVRATLRRCAEPR